jgi:hypothetical protein
MGDPEEPSGELGGVVELGQVLVSLEEDVLGEVLGILAAAVRQTEQVIENTPLPAGYEEVISLHIALASLRDQVAILDLTEDQMSSSVTAFLNEETLGGVKKTDDESICGQRSLRTGVTYLKEDGEDTLGS